MKSVVELDIKCRQEKVAQLFADPANDPMWMDDLERIERISGNPGEPGSIYRLIPKDGKMVFVATVVYQDLPSEVRLALDEATVSVAITDRFFPLSSQTTRLVSEETFRFKGLLNKAVGLLARPAIKRAHRRHMESFKRFAESQSQTNQERLAHLPKSGSP